MKKLLLCALAVVLAACGPRDTVFAPAEPLAFSEDSLRKSLAENPARGIGIYHNYEFREEKDTPAPRGYKPFYISHYGRHGSRYHTPAMCNKLMPRDLMRADSAGLLTEKGKALLKDLKRILDAHEGQKGELSAVGEMQHRRLAERMCRRFPDVFRGRDSVVSRSSIYPRCLISMANFEGELLRTYPALRIAHYSGKNMLVLLAARYKGRDAYFERIRSESKRQREALFNPDRLLASLFTGSPESLKEVVREPQMLARSIFLLWGITEDIGMNHMDIRDYLTDEEIFLQSRLFSESSYAEIGPSAEYGNRSVPTAKPLLRHIVAQADAAIHSNRAADLRFGHDSGLCPLVALMGVRGMSVRVPQAESFRHWPSGLRIPMASNLQMVFYHHPGKEEILVKVLYNERETLLDGLAPKTGPYYGWEELKAHLNALVDAPDPEVAYLGPDGDHTYIPG